MTFDPDRPDAHVEERDVDAARQRAIERLAVVSLDGTLKGWDQTFASSAVAQHERNGKLSDAQWKHVLRIARTAPLVKRAPATPVPARTESEREMDEVEAQLDAILRDPNGDRCVLANDEAAGRAKSIARALGHGAGGDGPLAGTPRLPEYGMGTCGSCFIGGVRGCVRCARGEAHPGEPCDSPHRTRFCRGWSLLATLRARALDAAGRHDDAAAVREDMGLARPAAPETEVKP